MGQFLAGAGAKASWPPPLDPPLIINHLGESHPQLVPKGRAERPKSLGRAGKLNSAFGWARKMVSPWVGQENSMTEPTLGWGGKLLGQPKSVTML